MERVKDKEKIEQLKKYLKHYKERILDHWTAKWRLKHLKNKKWFSGIILGTYTEACHIIDELMAQIPTELLNEKFLVKPTRRQKERYSIDFEWVATSLDVSINDIYILINPDSPEITKGETYHTRAKPYLLLNMSDIDGKFYGIFSDDPGQQDVIYFEKDWSEGLGAYNFCDAESFIHYWLHYVCEKGLKRIEDCEN